MFFFCQEQNFENICAKIPSKLVEQLLDQKKEMKGILN